MINICFCCLIPKYKKQPSYPVPEYKMYVRKSPNHNFFVTSNVQGQILSCFKINLSLLGLYYLYKNRFKTVIRRWKFMTKMTKFRNGTVSFRFSRNVPRSFCFLIFLVAIFNSFFLAAFSILKPKTTPESLKFV